MKDFLLKTLIFLLITIGIFHVKSFYLLQKNKYTQKVLGSEVYVSIEKSHKKSSAKKVLLGDSVGKQLFDNTENNDTINSLACNQAISMAGQYVLLHNYIAAGNKIDTAYICFTPFSFENNLDKIFTYNYFVKPFYRDENAALLTKTARRQVEKIPYSGLAWYPCILTNNWSPDFKSTDKVNYTFLSPISTAYLHKMSDLAKAHHFKLILISALLSNQKKKAVEALNKREIKNNHLESEFAGFFESIVYLEESNFVDGTHLKHPEQFQRSFKNRLTKPPAF